MRRAATARELNGLTETARARYDGGTPFSYAQIGQAYRLTPLAGPAMAGAYIVQQPHAALRRALTEIEEQATR